MAFQWTWWKVFLICSALLIGLVVGLGFIWPIWYGLAQHGTVSHNHIHSHQDSKQTVSLNGLGIGFVFNKDSSQSSRLRFSEQQGYLTSAEIAVSTSASGTGMKVTMEVLSATPGVSAQANHAFISTAGSGYQKGDTITITLDDIAAGFQAVISNGTCENPGFDTSLEFVIGDLKGGGTATISDEGNYWEAEVGAAEGFNEAWVTLEFETYSPNSPNMRKISPNDHDRMLVTMTGTQQPTLGIGLGSVASSIYQMNDKTYITIERRTTSTNLSSAIIQISLNDL